MTIAFDYRVTFQDGVTVDRHDRLFPEFTNEEYCLIVKGLVGGYAFTAIPGIEPILSKLHEDVEFGEQYLTINGNFLDKPIRKRRVIERIEFSIPEKQLKKMLAFRDHIELLDKPEESMTVYRTDGSHVKIKTVFGEVWLTDSRGPSATTKTDADYFLSRVL